MINKSFFSLLLSQFHESYLGRAECYRTMLLLILFDFVFSIRGAKKTLLAPKSYIALHNNCRHLLSLQVASQVYSVWPVSIYQLVICLFLYNITQQNNYNAIHQIVRQCVKLDPLTFLLFINQTNTKTPSIECAWEMVVRILKSIAACKQI